MVKGDYHITIQLQSKSFGPSDCRNRVAFGLLLCEAAATSMRCSARSSRLPSHLSRFDFVGVCQSAGTCAGHDGIATRNIGGLGEGQNGILGDLSIICRIAAEPLLLAIGKLGMDVAAVVVELFVACTPDAAEMAARGSDEIVGRFIDTARRWRSIAAHCTSDNQNKPLIIPPGCRSEHDHNLCIKSLIGLGTGLVLPSRRNAALVGCEGGKLGRQRPLSTGMLQAHVDVAKSAAPCRCDT